jgi:hypothetical protein
MMNVVKTLALVSALFAAQSAMAGTYDFGLMGPPDSKTITASADSILGDTDTFTFSINAAANATGSAPDVPLALSWFKLTGVEVWSVKLLDSTNAQIGATDYTTDNFSFGNLAAGSYSLVVKTYGNTNYNVTLTTASAATAVPEPEAYAMMLAGLGLVGFAARRKFSA